MRRSDGTLAAGSAFGAAGAAMAALLGTLCCAGPAVVAILGAGGALTAAKLEPYRPYFLTASGVMLAFGFWRAYRPSPTGVACSVRTGKVVRSILWAAALVTLASVIAPRFWS